MAAHHEVAQPELHRTGAALTKLAIALALLLSPGCALLAPNPVEQPAKDTAEDIHDALADGTVDESEMKTLDRDAGKIDAGFEEKRRRMASLVPKTGNPMLDWAVEIGKGLLLGGATWKAVNVSRDRRRKKRGEPVETEKVA